MTLYNRKQKNICIFSIIFGVIIVLFMVFSKRISSEREYVLDDDVISLKFSHESGFYDKSFELEISSPVGVVYYTLDGAIPDNNSFKYEKPILINDASKNENIYSIREDVSTAFMKTEIAAAGLEAQETYVPDFLVDKATVVRAIIYIGDEPYSKVKTATYFVDYDEKSGYNNMNFISIVSEPEAFFGYDKGIYVTGKATDDYLEQRKKADKKVGDCSWWDANYRGRGNQYEADSVIQFFDSDRRIKLSQECAVRIHGAYSRYLNQKSLTLRAKKKYNNSCRFLYPFFERGVYEKNIVLSSGGNDIRAKVKDYLVENITRDLKIVTLKMEPCVMFLNGEYWGMYWLTQKYDDDIFFHNEYGVDSDNVIVLKDNTLEYGEENDYNLYGQMQNFGIKADMTNTENYQKFCSYVDIDSYIDYFATMMYLARTTDWPSSNVAVWRTRHIQDDKYGDGKWRWILFDLNSACMTSNLVDRDIYEDALKDEMFANLYTNEDFREAIDNRLLELSETVFDSKRVDKVLKEYKDLYHDSLIKSDHRFFGQTDGVEIENTISDIDTFFIERQKYVREYIKIKTKKD